jgi:hypothetical protein
LLGRGESEVERAIGLLHGLLCPLLARNKPLLVIDKYFLSGDHAALDSSSIVIPL